METPVGGTRCSRHKPCISRRGKFLLGLFANGFLTRLTLARNLSSNGGFAFPQAALLLNADWRLFAGARPLYRRRAPLSAGLAIKEKALGADHPA